MGNWAICYPAAFSYPNTLRKILMWKYFSNILSIFTGFPIFRSLYLNWFKNCMMWILSRIWCFIVSNYHFLIPLRQPAQINMTDKLLPWASEVSHYGLWNPRISKLSWIQIEKYRKSSFQLFPEKRQIGTVEIVPKNTHWSYFHLPSKHGLWFLSWDTWEGRINPIEFNSH